MRALSALSVLAILIASCTVATTEVEDPNAKGDDDNGSWTEHDSSGLDGTPYLGGIWEEAGAGGSNQGGEGGEGGEGGGQGGDDICAQQVAICHHPPGHAGLAFTITVGAPAIPAHVEHHGDTIGACDGPSLGLPEAVCDEPWVDVICHVPPGNLDNPHTLHVGEAAMKAHLGHGDHLGYCDL